MRSRRSRRGEVDEWRLKPRGTKPDTKRLVSLKGLEQHPIATTSNATRGKGMQEDMANSSSLASAGASREPILC